MANTPFDKEVINARERPLSSDVNMVSSYSPLELAFFMQCLYSTRTALNDSHAVVQPAIGVFGAIGPAFTPRDVAPVAMNISFDAGLGVINDGSTDLNVGGISGMNDGPYKPVVMLPVSPTGVFSGIPGGGGLERVDVIELKLPRRYIDPTSRDVLNPSTGAFAPDLVNKTLTYAVGASNVSVNGTGILNYKTGTPTAGAIFGSPGVGVPTVDPGYVPLGYVNVGPATTTIPPNRIIDMRQPLYPGGVLRLQVNFTATSGPTVVVDSLVAPPGVYVTAVITSVAAAAPAGFIYVLCGDAAQFASLSINTSVDSIFGALASNGLQASVAQVVYTDGALQTALAAASPSLQVGIGQPLLRFPWSTLGLSGGTPFVISPATCHSTIMAGY